MTPAPARSHRRTHARSTAPRAPRRVSGPVNRRMVAAPAGTATLPRRSGTTGLFARVRALPEHRVIDRLLRSRAWIWALGALLGGIVAMQVSLLKLNSGISRAVEASATLERQNADMQANIARLSSGQRVSGNAAKENMVFPPAGDVRYLNVRPSRDATLATKRMTAPSAAAQALMAAGGHGTETTATGTTAAATPSSTATTPTATTTPASTTTTPTTTTPTTSTPTSTTAPTTTSSAATAAVTSAASGQG
jgi:hypothetical protein